MGIRKSIEKSILLCYNEVGDTMKEKKNLKYTIIVIVMFIVGIVIGVAISKTGFTNSKKTESELTLEAAKKVALENAKKDFKKEAVLDTEVSGKIDYEDNIKVYEIDFIIEGVEYHYEINASDGTIIDKDRDIITNQNPSNNGSTSNQNQISLEEAKKIVLKDINKEEKEVTFIEQKEDRDNGIFIYKITFYTSEKEYEFEVKKENGEIIEKEMELRNKVIGGTKNLKPEEAKDIVLKSVGLKDNEVVVQKIELEKEINYNAYEIEFYKDNKEYDFEVDVSSGTILKSSWKLK